MGWHQLLLPVWKRVCKSAEKDEKIWKIPALCYIFSLSLYCSLCTRCCFSWMEKNVRQNTEYRHCHRRSSFPSSVAHFFLQRTELQLTSWGEWHPRPRGPQMPFVCFPRPWPPGSRSLCRSGSGSICSSGGRNAVRGLGMIRGRSWSDFLAKRPFYRQTHWDPRPLRLHFVRSTSVLRKMRVFICQRVFRRVLLVCCCDGRPGSHFQPALQDDSPLAQECLIHGGESGKHGE